MQSNYNVFINKKFIVIIMGAMKIKKTKKECKLCIA